jgi:SAM-dependent methyltransferase
MKPSHLAAQYGAQFQDQSIAEVYQHRPPYAEATILKLLDLMTDEPRHVLDAGCGTGDLARRLVSGVERIDAVDASAAMLAKGKTLPGGDHPRLRWMHSRIEDAALDPPYALIMAGESAHWMDWTVIFSHFARILTRHGYLAIVERGTESSPWDDALMRLIQQHSTNKEYQPYNLIAELEQRSLFRLAGVIHMAPVPFAQSGEDFLLSIHSRNGFSRERMGEVAARAFDEAARAVIAPFLHDGQLTFSTVDTLTWGKPLA